MRLKNTSCMQAGTNNEIFHPDFFSFLDNKQFDGNS